MNISKESWHYRLLKGIDLLKSPIYGAESLCPYFWKVVFAAVVLPVIALAVAWIGTMPLWWWLLPDMPLGLVIFIGLSEIAALLFILKTLVELRHMDEVTAGTREAPEVKESLLKAWLKAKHRQVCPLIDFVGE